MVLCRVLTGGPAGDQQEVYVGFSVAVVAPGPGSEEYDEFRVFSLQYRPGDGDGPGVRVAWVLGEVMDAAIGSQLVGAGRVGGLSLCRFGKADVVAGLRRLDAAGGVIGGHA